MNIAMKSFLGSMTAVLATENPYHPTLRAIRGGPFCVTAYMDDVLSNQLCLEFRY